MNDCGGVIEGNLIAGNSADDGGGFSRVEGETRDNVIERNTASGRGGGGNYIRGVFERNIVRDNHAGSYGGGWKNDEQYYAEGN